MTCKHEWNPECMICLRDELRITTDPNENGRRLMHHIQLNGWRRELNEKRKKRYLEAVKKREDRERRNQVQPSLELYDTVK